MNKNSPPIRLFRSIDAERKNYKKDSVILQIEKGKTDICVIEKGLAYLTALNDDGEKNILDYYEPGDIFGSVFFSFIHSDLYYVIAKKDCAVYHCTYEKLTSSYGNDATDQTKLINRMIVLSISRKQVHLDILSQRTIRNKLMTYFRHIAENTSSKEIVLPISLSDLADYLSVDRSAMMREMKKMNSDGLIQSKGKKIVLP